MALRDWLTPFRDRRWQRTHIVAHLIGGVVWYLLLSVAPPFAALSAWWRVYWVAVIQGAWERYQAEYESSYPVWSMVADTLITVAAAALCAAIRWRVG